MAMMPHAVRYPLFDAQHFKIRPRLFEARRRFVQAAQGIVDSALPQVAIRYPLEIRSVFKEQTCFRIDSHCIILALHTIQCLRFGN